MKKPGFYSTGDIMKLAHITKKTVRYYDEHNILKPSYVAPSGARFYTENDLALLQQILLFKYLGFPLKDIREMTIHESDHNYLIRSLKLQSKLVQDQIEQLQVVAQAITDTTQAIEQNRDVDWSKMLNLIHYMSMEESIRTQYQNANNIASRINLHKLYSANKQGWFPWIYDHLNLKPHEQILELGCGDGSFWTENEEKLPQDLNITISDISEGMLRDARNNIADPADRFQYASFDCQQIPYDDHSFDSVIANHVLFYCKDITEALSQISRVLKPNGTFICSTYGSKHMKEINRLVTGFDDRIILSANKLYEIFGRENGASVCSRYFTDVHWISYQDELVVPDAEPLISYILSCHGNQNQYILDRYSEFRTYVQQKIGTGFHITKDAGIFICKK